MAYERITNEKMFDGKVRDSHEVRYMIASQYITSGDTVADCACGTGYGSQTMCFVCDCKILQYDKEDIDLEKEEVTDEFDVFVGLETIEHLDPVDFYVRSAKRAKKKMIISTPIVPNTNPFHKQHFNKQEVLDLFIDDNWELYEYFEQNEMYGIFVFNRKA